ncbi:MAG: succinate dehydrogenase assembly factor 2 [Phyllobacterium sp.]
MSDTKLANIELDARRKRILFRSWHRGMREADLILGQFADKHIAELSESDLQDYENLLEVLDRDLLKWILGEEPTPESFDTPVFRHILAFRRTMSF